MRCRLADFALTRWIACVARLLRCASLVTIAYHLHLSVADISSLLLAQVSPHLRAVFFVCGRDTAECFCRGSELTFSARPLCVSERLEFGEVPKLLQLHFWPQIKAEKFLQLII